MATPGQITAAVTAAANYLAQQFSSEELAVLAAVFVQLGDTLATILAQQDLLEAKSSMDS